MDKRSSARAASIAARVLDGGKCTQAEARTLAASVLAQRLGAKAKPAAKKKARP